MSQDTRELALDKNTRSIIEAEESVTLVGSVTICVNWKSGSRRVKYSVGLCRGSMLKSPQRMRL